MFRFPAAALLLLALAASAALSQRTFVFSDETFTPTKQLYTFAGVDLEGEAEY